MILKWTCKWEDDPKEFMNWVFHHGNAINFSSLFLSTELSIYISYLPEFKKAADFNKRSAEENDGVFYYGDLLGISIWRDANAERDWGEIIDHNYGRTKEIKALVRRWNEQ